MAKKYKEWHAALIDKKQETAVRYQAAVEILNGINTSATTAAAAAQDVKSYIQLMKEAREGNLLQVTMEVLFKLSMLKGNRETYSKGGFPEFCINSVRDDRFRMKSSSMVHNLLKENEMTTEMVDIGMVDVLIRYSDNLDRSLLSTQPGYVLKTRRFVFSSLKLISDSDKYADLLIEKGLLDFVKKSCFNLSIATDLSRSLNISRETVIQVHVDEMALHEAGMEIIFNLVQRFENFGRLFKAARKAEVKYIYDFDSEDEEAEPNLADLDMIKAVETIIDLDFSEGAREELQQAHDPSKNLLLQIQRTHLLNEVLEACVQLQPAVSLAGLKVVYRLGSVLHFFTSVGIRAAIVTKILEIAERFSGQRRYSCLSCLLVLAQHPENCQVFLKTSVFRTLFFLGMEESGEVLNQLVKVLKTLAQHRTTSQEQALRSLCPKLIVKILHDDLKGKVAFTLPRLADAQDDAREAALQLHILRSMAFEKTGPACITALYLLALHSEDAKKKIINAGALPVLSKIHRDHPKDLVGMHCLMALSVLLTVVDKKNGSSLPVASPDLREMLLEAFENSLTGRHFQGLIFSSRELSYCIKCLTNSFENAKVFSTGLPLFLRAISIFVKDYGVQKEEKVTSRTMEYLAGILYNISRVKRILPKMIELGASLEELLQDAHDRLSEAQEDDLYLIDNKGATLLESVQLTISDESDLAKIREKNNLDMRKSSRVRWSKVLKKEDEFKNFIAEKRMVLDL